MTCISGMLNIIKSMMRLSLISVIVLIGCKNSSVENNGIANDGIATIQVTGSSTSSKKFIYGTIYFGSEIPSNSNIIVGYNIGAPSIGGYISNGYSTHSLTANSSSIKFKIIQLAPIFPGDFDKYTVWARVDTNKDNIVNSGDLGGYFYSADSNTSTTYDKASIIDLTNIDSSEANFTLSIEP